MTDISRHGITWTVSGESGSGTYVTGDPWVTPCSVIAISPTPITGGVDDTRHGSMINPSSKTDWAFDGRVDTAATDTYGQIGFTHNEGLNVAASLPLALTAGQSLVSVESASPGSSTLPPGGSTNIVPLADAAVLTCVASDPGATAFRPPWWGSTKTQWYTTDIVQSLPMLTAPFDPTASASFKLDMTAGLPAGQTPLIHTAAGTTTSVQAPSIHCWTPSAACNWYGSNTITGLGPRVGQMALAACFNLSGNEITLRNRLIQLGIDFWAVFNDGGSRDIRFSSFGAGFGPGRWFPIAFAGWMLGDDDMLNCASGSTGRTPDRGLDGWFWEQGGAQWYADSAWADYRSPRSRASYGSGYPLYGDVSFDGLFPGNHSRRDPNEQFDGFKGGASYPYAVTDGANTVMSNATTYMQISSKCLPQVWMAFQLLGMPRSAWPSAASWDFCERWCNDKGMWTNFGSDFTYQSESAYHEDLYGFGGTGNGFARSVYNSFFKARNNAGAAAL